MIDDGESEEGKNRQLGSYAWRFSSVWWCSPHFDFGAQIYDSELNVTSKSPNC